MSFFSNNLDIPQPNSNLKNSFQRLVVESPKTDRLTVPSIWSRSNPLELCEEHRFIIGDSNKLKH